LVDQLAVDVRGCAVRKEHPEVPERARANNINNRIDTNDRILNLSTHVCYGSMTTAGAHAVFGAELLAFLLHSSIGGGVASSSFNSRFTGAASLRSSLRGRLADLLRL
jgi:hypothetical protein